MHRPSRRNGPLPNTSRLCALTLALILIAPDANAQDSEPAQRPNILLLMAEDLSPRIGAFGDDLARTPTLDRLASEGVRFTNVFTTAGVCAPSRSGLILGMHAISSGTHHMRTFDGPKGEYLSVPPPDAKAYPETLRAGGYFTYQHAKLDYQFSGPFSNSGPESIWDAEDNDGEWADRAEGQPFFGMITYMVTHESGIFEPLGSAWPNGIMHFIMQVMQAYHRWGFTDGVVPTKPEDIVVPPYYPDIPEVRASMARHYDNIQIMDAQVGDVLARLERDGLADSTIVIWTTDHGDGLPRAKRDLFDLGIEVPMIIRWPESMRPEGFVPGTSDNRLISFVDLTATILAMAGLPRPDHYQGHDFLDPDRTPREYIYASRDRIDDKTDRQRAVRDKRFKYIKSFMPEIPGGHPIEFRDNLPIMQGLWRELEAERLNATQRRWFEPVGEERLFDLEEDPLELHDVSTNPAYRADLDRMRAEYARFAERVPDLAAEPEEAMRLRFWPDGEQPETAAPTFRGTAGGIEISSESPGASIEVAIDGGPFRLYTEAMSGTPGQTWVARAIRYGWAPSDEIEWTVPTASD